MFRLLLSLYALFAVVLCAPAQMLSALHTHEVNCCVHRADEMCQCCGHAGEAATPKCCTLTPVLPDSILPIVLVPGHKVGPYGHLLSVESSIPGLRFERPESPPPRLV